MSKIRKIVLLVDYKGEYFPRQKRSPLTTDLKLLQSWLGALDLELETLPFADVRLENSAFKGVPVFYQSSQDSDLHYKGYIEDLLFGLELLGAQLVPGLPFFRAHHNKVMMELLRDLCGVFGVRSLKSQVFGTLEDFEEKLAELPYPVVIKRSDGDSARGVILSNNPTEARSAARSLMRSIHPGDLWDNVSRSIRGIPIKPHSLYRRKIIVQPYVPGLDHDFKAVWMGRRVFVEIRKTRKGDFRASGSGQRSFPTDVSTELLDLVENIGLASGSAHASIDLMVQGDAIHVGEMQFIRFGMTPVLMAPHAWTRGPHGWSKVQGPFCWEEELAHSMACRLSRPPGDSWSQDRNLCEHLQRGGQKNPLDGTLADAP